MRIRCPFCGDRASSEFTYRGAANFERPDFQEPDAEIRFFEVVYLRDNPAGLHKELWYHVSGCCAWLCVTRDTRTHQIFAVELAVEAAAS